MKRRAFISLLGGAAVARPLAVRAQQDDRVRRIALLLGVADDREGAMAGVLGIAPLNNSSRFAISSLMNSVTPGDIATRSVEAAAMRVGQESDLAADIARVHHHARDCPTRKFGGCNQQNPIQ